MKFHTLSRKSLHPGYFLFGSHKFKFFKDEHFQTCVSAHSSAQAGHFD